MFLRKLRRRLHKRYVLFLALPTCAMCFSAFDGEPGDLDVGDEVEYAVTKKTAKVSAEYIKKLPKGTVNPEVSPPPPGLLH